MGLDKLYNEAKEVSDTINEINTELKEPVIAGPILYHTVDFLEKTGENLNRVLEKNKTVSAKIAQQASKNPIAAVVAAAVGIAVVGGGTMVEVVPDAVRDIATNVAAKKAATEQLEEYKKVLAAKCSLIIEEQQKLIKAKIQTKNDEKEKQRELEERIVRLSALIEKCNSLLNK